MKLSLDASGQRETDGEREASTVQCALSSFSDDEGEQESRPNPDHRNDPEKSLAVFLEHLLKKFKSPRLQQGRLSVAGRCRLLRASQG